MNNLTTKVLIIGGSETDRQSYEHMLTLAYPLHYEFLAVGSGKDAIKYNIAFVPDCILIDFSCLDVDGIQLITELKSPTLMKNPAIIMLATISTFGLTDRALEVGATNYIMKMHLHHSIKELHELINASISKEIHHCKIAQTLAAANDKSKDKKSYIKRRPTLTVTSSLNNFHLSDEKINDKAALKSLANNEASILIERKDEKSSVTNNVHETANYAEVLFIDNATHPFLDFDEVYPNEKFREQMPLCDDKTGLVSKQVFNYIVEKNIKQENNCGQKLSLLLVTIKNYQDFRRVLDLNGLNVLLKNVSKRLKDNVRKDDLLSRTAQSSEDEFCILFNGIHDFCDVALIARKLINSMTAAVEVNEHKLMLNINIGISCFPIDSTDIAGLQKNSLTALYDANTQEGSAYSFYNSKIASLDRHQLAVMRELQFGISRNEFYLSYQEIADLKSRKKIIQEARIRWSHPSLDIIGPREFIKMAERTQFIVPITKWIIAEAVLQFQQWQYNGVAPDKILITVSRYALWERHFVTEVQKIISASKIDPQVIVLAISESALSDRPYITQTIINELHGLGFKICIEHYGAGLSNLAYLAQQTIDYLKIDSQLIKSAIENKISVALIRSIISIGRSLDIDVIASGIETQAQFELLQKMDCPKGQGYYLGKSENSKFIAPTAKISVG